jgi:hypothetical protein
MNETVERLARAIAYASPNGNLSWDRYSSEARNRWRRDSRHAHADRVDAGARFQAWGIRRGEVDT